MVNLTKIKRDKMIGFLEELKSTFNDDDSIRAFNEIENALTEKKFGLVFEEHTEEFDERLLDEIPIFCADESRKICKDKDLPYNFIIEGDNLQALNLLEKTHRGKVDCIYIDPPYNTGARDWKYNNDYADKNDIFRHSKWLSMMKHRLDIAKKLLKEEGVLICAIDKNEQPRLMLLLEDVFGLNYTIDCITIVHNPRGVQGKNFSYTHEYAIFVYKEGSNPIQPRLIKEEEIDWRDLRDNGGESRREDAAKCFYSINIKDGEIIGFGPNMTQDDTFHPEKNVENDDGSISIYPIDRQGIERKWRYSVESVPEIIDKLRIKEVNGVYDIQLGKNTGKYKTVWINKSFDSNEYGKKLINSMVPDNDFDFPKSIYNTFECLNTVVRNNPHAIILDFFAGSGTTMHALNLLNASDNGNRLCILVTNNELSEAETKILTKEGYGIGDEEWENHGIAKQVTWPRTYCSINGKDIGGNSLSGNYGVEVDEYKRNTELTVVSKSTGRPVNRKIFTEKKVQLYPELAEIKKSDGFNANVKYFKCDWTPRKPDDYLLSNALLLHIKEMIELENFIEIDNERYVVILNKDDFNEFILNDEIYDKIEKLWVNQNIIFTSEELKLLRNKKFKYIPKEYFGHELKEAAE